MPDGDHQQRAGLAGDQADHDPALARRPAQARHPLRPRDRGVGAGRRRRACRSRQLAGTAFIGELTLDGNLRSVTGVLPMVLAAAERGVRRVFVPEPQAARGGDGARTWRCSGCARSARWSRELRGEEVPEAPPVAADVGRPAAELARRGAAGGDRHGRPARPGRRRGTPSRWPPPASHHLLLSGPEGRRQDQPRRADPGHPARPHPDGVARADRDPLARRHPRPGAGDGRPAAVLGARTTTPARRA